MQCLSCSCFCSSSSIPLRIIKKWKTIVVTLVIHHAFSSRNAKNLSCVPVTELYSNKLLTLSSTVLVSVLSASLGSTLCEQEIITNLTQEHKSILHVASRVYVFLPCPPASEIITLPQKYNVLYTAVVFCNFSALLYFRTHLGFDLCEVLVISNYYICFVW